MSLISLKSFQKTLEIESEMKEKHFLLLLSFFENQSLVRVYRCRTVLLKLKRRKETKVGFRNGIAAQRFSFIR